MHEGLHANDPLTTNHRRLQYYKVHYNYVQPVEVSLTYNDRGQKRHYHYIPVLQRVRALPREENAAQQSLNPRLDEDGVLHDVTDGHVVRSNPLFLSTPPINC